MASENKRKTERLLVTQRNTASASSLPVLIGSDLDVVLDDRRIKSDPHENRNRRTIVVKQENGSFGFTLESYGLQRINSGETDLLSYVDYVELGGPAYKAGMREGDVILSINGKSMENVDHEKLVDCIKCCEDSIRMVVLFEDVCRKIDLHLRYLKLKQILEAKKVELRSLSEKEAKLLQKVGAVGGDSINTPESVETSSVFGSIYFSCGGEAKLSERDTSSSSVFQSTSDLGQVFDSPGVTSLDLRSSAVCSPTQSVESPQVEVVRSVLLSYDDAFWSSNSGYGSLPIRSQKRGAKSASAASRRTASVRWQVGNRPLVSATLHEEGDEANDFHPTRDNPAEGFNLSGSAASSKAISSTTNFAPQKLAGKKSTSVPNLIKLKIQNSPFLSRRLLSERPTAKQKLTSNDDVDLDVRVVHDPRSMTKQLRQEISNYVITEYLDRRPDDPQLLGLRQLCNDFRFGCIQESLKQRRKSIELKMSLDPNGNQVLKKKSGFQVVNPFRSVRSRRNRKPTGLGSNDLSRQFHELDPSEIDDAAKIAKSLNSSVEERDEQSIPHDCVLYRGECGSEQRQRLPKSVFDSSRVVEESHVLDLEVGHGRRKPPEKWVHEKMVPQTENSSEFPYAGCDASQCISPADEVTHL